MYSRWYLDSPAKARNYPWKSANKGGIGGFVSTGVSTETRRTIGRRVENLVKSGLVPVGRIELPTKGL
jgi:hypothetical protein